MANDLADQLIYDFAIVGAGISGLAAAYRLQQKGYKVIVLEKAPDCGGRVSTRIDSGYPIDIGAQFFASPYSQVLKLIEELGLKNELVESTQFAATFRDGRFRRINKNNPFTLYLSGTLSFLSCLKLFKALFLLKKRIGKFEPEVISNWIQFDDEDSASWARNNLGQETLDYLVEPFISGFTYCDPKDTSNFLVLRMLAHFMANSSILSLKNGLASLPKALALNLKILYNERVRSVVDDNGISILSLENDIIKARRVIYAIPAFEAKKIVPQSYQNKWSNVLATNYASTIHFSFKATGSLDSIQSKVYGVMIGKNESELINVISFENNKHLHQLSKNPWIINVMLTSHGARKLKGESENNIVKKIKNEIGTLFPQLNNNLEVLSYKSWEHAIPIMKPGHIMMISKYRESLRNGDNHFLVGDYLGTPCVEGAVESSIKVSELFKVKT